MNVKFGFLIAILPLAACGSKGTETAVPSTAFLLSSDSLHFSTQPTDGTCGSNLAPVAVEVLDSSGTRVTDADAVITLALAANGNTASLCVAESAQTVDGVATFDTVCTHDAMQGYTLVASGARVVNATSAPFDVVLATIGEPCSIPQDCSGNLTGEPCRPSSPEYLTCGDQVCIPLACPASP